MADAVLEVEAKFINNLSAGLKVAQRDVQGLEQTTTESMGRMASAHSKAEQAASRHAEIFGLSMREIKKSSTEGMMGVAVATEIANQGFVGARGALEAFNIGMVAMASGPVVGVLIAIGAAISAVAEHFKKLKEAALAVDWYGESEKVERINDQFGKTITLQDDLEKALISSSSQMGNTYSLAPILGWVEANKNASSQLKDSAKQAEDQFQELTGTTAEAFMSAIGGMEKTKELLAELTTAAKDYEYAIEQMNEKENEKAIAQAKSELEIAKLGPNEEVKRVKLESEAKVKQMDYDQEVRKAKLLQYSAEITQLEKSLETKKSVGGEEGRKAREEIEKRLEVVRQGYDKENGEVEAGETILELTRAKAAAEVTRAKIDKARKDEYLEADIQNKVLASQREHQAKIRAAAKKEQDEAVKADEERTKQIYEARNKLQDYKERLDPVAQLKTQLQRELDAVGLNESAKHAIKERYALMEQDLQKQAILQTGHVIADGLSAIMSLYHKHGAEYKAWAEAKNLVDTALSAQAAYASAASIPFVGQIMGPIAAGAAIIAGVAEANKIASAQFALGTLNAPGGVAIVGERGPEAVRLPQGATVYDHNETQRMLSPAGITHTGDVVFNLQVPHGMSPQQASNFGASMGEGYIRYLAGLKKAIKDIDYYNPPEMV